MSRSVALGEELRVCIVICTYRRFDVLPEAIESALAQNYRNDSLEVIVVDNSGQPSLSETFARQYARSANLNYIIEPVPGLSRARNIGWRNARADIIAYMDDDAIADPGWVTSLVEAFLACGKEAAVVGGMVKPIWPTAKPSWIHKYNEGFLSIVDWGGERRATNDREWLAGTNVSFRRNLLEDFGGFDEALGRTEASLLSNEEIALVAKIKSSGGNTIYEPEAIVHHMISPSRLSHDWFRRRSFWQAVSDLIMHSNEQLVPEHVWDGIAKYFRKLPAPSRTPAGFFANPSDPELFHEQLNAIYCMVRMMGYGLACPATSLLAPLMAA